MISGLSGAERNLLLTPEQRKELLEFLEASRQKANSSKGFLILEEEPIPLIATNSELPPVVPGDFAGLFPNTPAAATPIIVEDIANPPKATLPRENLAALKALGNNIKPPQK